MSSNSRWRLGVVGLIVLGLSSAASGQERSATATQTSKNTSPTALPTPPSRPGEGMPEKPTPRPTEKLPPELVAPETSGVFTPIEVNGKDLIKTWPDPSRRAAANMIGEYGQPHEVTDTMLVWHAVAPWKRVVVWRDAVPHDFPRPHADVLEQAIDYRVPAEKLADLARFEGSILVDRTRGELAARSQSEEMNRLALNLAHDLLRGKRTVEDA